MRLWCICCELTDPTVGECLGVESGQNVEELRPQFEEVIATLSKADELYAKFLRTHDVLALSLDENQCRRTSTASRLWLIGSTSHTSRCLYLIWLNNKRKRTSSGPAAPPPSLQSRHCAYANVY
jgi:hypothetical protein